MTLNPIQWHMVVRTMINLRTKFEVSDFTLSNGTKEELKHKIWDDLGWL